MKNLKKVLAMVLAFACTFTMFASAKLYEDVAPGSDFSEAITMLSDLGIIQGKTDNKYHPEDTITRAEACALIARLMTGDPNAAGFNNAHHFKDVPAGFWASSAIGYCVVNGIAIGVDQAGTRFEPQRPIKDKEFVTMIVRALGYETPDMRNNFPFGYMSAANAIGLLQGVNMVPDTDALRGEDAQVIYNAMFVDYARGAKRVNVAHGTTVESYPTLAEDVWHLDRAAVGTWNKHDKDDEDVTLSNCKAHTWVIVGKDDDENILAYPIEDGNTDKDSRDIYESLEKKDKNDVKAAAYKFKYEGTGDIEALRGYKVELWGSGKHGEATWDKGEGKYVFSNDWKIKAIKTIAGQTKFDYDASKADSKRDDGEIKVDEETTLKLENASKNAQKVSEKNTSKTDRTTYISKEEYNREKAKDDEKLEAALNVRDGAKYRLMDWDGDKEIDWVVVDEASYYKVESVSSKRLTVTSMVDTTKNKKNEEEETESLTQTWKLDDDNEIFTDKDKKNSYKITYKAPEGLKEGDIIEVAYSTGYDEITGTISVVEPENHKLEKVATKDHLTLTFDGQVTELAQNKNEADTIVPTNPTKYINFDEEELGTEFAVAKNRNGFIIHSDYATDTANYMMVLETDDGKNTVRGELGAMKFVTADNKVETNVEVVSDLRIDGNSKNNGYDKDNRSFDEDRVVGNVYKYWKDADGKITKLESMVSTKSGKQADSYEYVAKNDRLTIHDNNESYALKDAKVIFAVKPHNGSKSTDYIQHQKDGKLKVDDADVLAVKASDIPDIDVDEDTNISTLDRNATSMSWVANTRATVAFDTNNNKDIKGAVLGVNNFNKFNAGSTKVGLVSNVSFDNNGVVSLEVATNGKTDDLSSAEKVKFEDIVSVKDYANDKSVSVGSRTETINAGIMKGKSLKEYLHKNGAYAEITTDKDGKLTGVLFMDNKTKDDGVDPTLNAGNAVIGNYYQVSRKVIADVQTGNWMSVVEGSATYANEDNFRSLDTKNYQKASDFASDAAYYVINGAPTRNGVKSYTDTKATILDGFDGTPDVKVGEASDVVASEIRNNNHNGDSYNVADIASKIDAKGAGDVVAVYAYKDDMGEADAINMATVVVKDAADANVIHSAKPSDTVKVHATVEGKLLDNVSGMDSIKVLKDGKVIETLSATSGHGTREITAEWNIPASASGEYVLQGAYRDIVFGGGTAFVVDAGTQKFVADRVYFANWDGTKYQVTGTKSGELDIRTANSFAIYVGGDRQTRAAMGTPVTTLTERDLIVKLANVQKNVTKLENMGDGYYVVTIDGVDLEKAPDNTKVLTVELTGKDTAVASGLNALVANPAADGTQGTGGNTTTTGNVVQGVNNLSKIAVVDKIPTDSAVKTFEVEAQTSDKNKTLVTGLTMTAKAWKNGTEVSGSNVTVAEKAAGTGVYTVTATVPADLRGHTVKISVDGRTDTFDINIPNADMVVKIDGAATKEVNETVNVAVTNTSAMTVAVENDESNKAELKIAVDGFNYTTASKTSAEKNGVTATLNNGQVTLSGTPNAVGQIVFTIGASNSAKATLTVNVQKAPDATLDQLGNVSKTKGVAGQQGQKATATFNVTDATAPNENLTVTVTGKQKDGQSFTKDVENITIPGATNNNGAADAIRKALQGAAEVAALYDVTGENAQVILTAKNPVDGESITLTAKSGATTKIAAGATTAGTASTPATKGKVEFTIQAASTVNEAWELTLEDATKITVNVISAPAETIAQLIKTAVENDAATKGKVTVDVSDATVTITETEAQAGQVITTNDTSKVTFQKKA